MKILSINVTSYGTGSIILSEEGTTINISLTEEDKNQLFAFGLRIFEKQQQTIAKSIANMKVEALPSPNVVDGEYTEVDDDIPF